jgi:hypothetical protein
MRDKKTWKDRENSKPGRKLEKKCSFFSEINEF